MAAVTMRTIDLVFDWNITYSIQSKLRFFLFQFSSIPIEECFLIIKTLCWGVLWFYVSVDIRTLKVKIFLFHARLILSMTKFNGKFCYVRKFPVR